LNFVTTVFGLSKIMSEFAICLVLKVRNTQYI
jgi:hypothetical protein